jgi:hypothetical protein
MDSSLLQAYRLASLGTESYQYSDDGNVSLLELPDIAVSLKGFCQRIPFLSHVGAWETILDYLIQ